MSRILVCAAICMLSGCSAMSPLPFTSVEQRFGYSLTPNVPSEPFAELTAPRKNGNPEVGATTPTAVPVPRPRPATSAVTELPVPAEAALPAYDDSKDPAVTAVLLPELTNAEVERFYRGPSGRVTLPQTAKLPIIETDSIRTALAGAAD